jgi:hypothetical protein
MNITDKLEKVFTNIYSENLWSMGQNDSKCGLGSSHNFTQHISNHLPNIINKYNIKNMIDTSCGDLYWMKHVFPKLNCTYLGIDIVKQHIDANISQFNSQHTQFHHGDFVEYLKTLPNKSVDLILCRHTCEHLPDEHIMQFLNEAQRTTKYLLVTTHKNATHNTNVIITDTPYRPINLNITPYSEYIGHYQIDSLYDGPEYEFRSEMYINLYHFQ